MLLSGYHLEIVNSACNPGAIAVHCFAHLDQDISAALPYVNAILGGLTYVCDPPSVTFKVHGRLITLYSRKIAVNALKDAAEAEKIVDWLKREINTAWDNREQITPSTSSRSSPKFIEILKLLPKTNCRQCGYPTCMVFATHVAEGARAAQDCPPLTGVNRERLDQYLSQFHFED